MHTPKRKTQKSPKKPVHKSITHKLRSVRKVLDGVSAVQVGSMYGDSSRAVSYWVTQFKEHGRAGLESAPHPGRPSKLTTTQMREVRAFAKEARAQGVNVTGEAISEFIRKKHRVKITRQHCRRILSRFGV